MTTSSAVRRWFARPQSGQADRDEEARVLWMISWGMVALIAAYSVTEIVFEPASTLRRVITLLGITTIVGVVHEMNRRGHIRQASWTLVVLLIAFLTQRAWITGGLHSPISEVYALFVMLAGVLLGPRGAAIAAVMAVAGGIVLLVAESTGTITGITAFQAPGGLLMFLTMVAAITVLLQQMVARTLRANLQVAQSEIAERKRTQLERDRLVHNLGERVKELRLLHATARSMQQAWPSTDELLRHLVQMMPAAWQHAECTAARITLGDVVVTTAGWRETEWMQSTTFVASGRAGRIEVVYTEPRPPEDEGPFVKEERALIESIAEMLVAHLESVRSRQELEELVREAERLRDDLTHMIVHDMRSPLTALLMQLSLLRMDVSGDTALAVDEASAAARQLNDLANTLLDVSKLEAGKMPIRKVPTDLVQIANEVRGRLGAIEREREIIVIASGPVIANCDAGLVRRVLDNLVSNGIKHSPSRGKLSIEVRSLPGKVRVTVQDEGDGIPPEARQRIFEKFGSVAVRRDWEYHSVGLGLAFCKLAVEAHGGTIGVEDAKPRGSIFAFQLPA